MNDNDIIKALECCVGKSLKRYLCLKCPLRDRDCYGGALLMPEVLELINRQKAEIERLTVNMNAFGLGIKREKERADTARTEAIREFAERLKYHAYDIVLYGEIVTVSRIERTMHEMMTEGEDGNL